MIHVSLFEIPRVDYVSVCSCRVRRPVSELAGVRNRTFSGRVAADSCLPGLRQSTDNERYLLVVPSPFRHRDVESSKQIRNSFLRRLGRYQIAVRDRLWPRRATLLLVSPVTVGMRGNLGVTKSIGMSTLSFYVRIGTKISAKREYVW